MRDATNPREAGASAIPALLEVSSDGAMGSR